MKTIAFLLITFLSVYQCFSQDENKRLINQKSAGILVEYGQPFYYIEEGTRYYVAMAGGKFGFPLFKTKKNFNLSLDLYPHYGHVWVVEDRQYYEFGLNVRLSLNFSLSSHDLLSAKIGSGPHYFTAETRRQTKGFIFSDYFLATYTRGFMISGKMFAVEFEFGYRHISNANLYNPNGGISNFVVGFGFYKSF